MAWEFFLTTNTPVTPVDQLGPRVSVGARCLAKRSGPGPIGISILRGDGGNPEAYTYAVDSRVLGPFLAAEEIDLELAAIDMLAPGTYPRTYQLRVAAIGGVDDISVRDANLATSPYSEPGLTPP